MGKTLKTSSARCSGDTIGKILANQARKTGIRRVRCNTAARVQGVGANPLLCEYTYSKMKFSLLYIPVRVIGAQSWCLVELQFFDRCNYEFYSLFFSKV